MLDHTDMSERLNRLPHFVDTAGAEDEQFGFGGHMRGYALPGEGDMFDGRMFVPNCNMEDAVFNDTVWMFGYPDRLRARDPENPVLEEIFYNDAIRRLQAVEQLTLPPQFSTIPNTSAFSRFEHIWGSVLFVRQMNELRSITGRTAQEAELRTLLSDVAHTFGSHLGDWMFQGTGGPENQHDIELESYLETVGINDILRKHDFNPKAVIFPEVNDWVEAKSPDLCVDRVDYGLREMNRWNDVVRLQAFKAGDFTITPDNMLAMKNQRRARVFAEGYLLLAQEHWSEPTHRLMEDLLILRTKLFYAEGRTPRTWVFRPLEDGLKDGALVPLAEIHPRDLMYVTDLAQLEAYALPNLGGHTLDAIMQSIAQYRRRYVWPGRRERIGRYMGQFAGKASYNQVLATGHFDRLDSPALASYKDEYPKTLPGGFAILDSEQATQTSDERFIDIPQPAFKFREIDPLVETATGFERLSVLDETYAERLIEYKRQMAREYTARLIVADPETHTMVRSIVDHTEAAWQERLHESRRMTPGELRSLVSISGQEVIGSYPFLTFLTY
jgi:hypothetical protein